MYDFLSPNKTNRDWKRGHEAMSQQILQVDQAMLETTLDRMVRKSVEETLNAMLDAEADEITGAARYERSGERKAYRAGHYERDLTVKAGKMSLKVPKLKGAVFESAVIEQYRRREESVEEALIDMYLAGVSTRQVDDVSQLLWGDRMPSQTLSDKLKKVYADIDEWRGRPLEQDYPYLFMDGVWHKRCWGGSVENVSILVAVGVGMDGRREVLSVAEGMKGGLGKLARIHQRHARARPQGREAGDGRPVRRTGGGCERIAARRPLPAVHGPLRTQHPRQGQPQKQGLGRRRAEGHILHGIEGQGAGEGGIRRQGHGGAETEGGRQMPQGGHRRDHDLPARRLPPRASPPHPNEQHDRTAEPRDPPAHARGRQLPGRAQRVDAHLRESPLRNFQRVVDATLPRHVKAR
ncbi:Transposase [Bifidobacterium longum E18]|nr:Transposase [Bifidobacterium longum E18]